MMSRPETVIALPVSNSNDPQAVFVMAWLHLAASGGARGSSPGSACGVSLDASPTCPYLPLLRGFLEAGFFVDGPGSISVACAAGAEERAHPARALRLSL